LKFFFFFFFYYFFIIFLLFFNYIGQKWEEIDAEEDVDNNKKLSYFTNYENGVKIITTYSENLKKQTVKTTKKIKEVIIKRKVNKKINERLNLKPFNVENKVEPTEPTDVVKIEPPKDTLLDFLKDTEYDYLFADQTDKTAKELRNRFKIIKDEETEEVKPEDPNALAPRKEPLYYRSHDTQNKECTVRVTNLREDVMESDLTSLFGKCGQISRMFLAKHKETQSSKGFAFVTYSKREDAKQAIAKLNRHCFENLVLNVEWARPSNR
uniref:Eukaryotic translation initiation factor 3 subunit G-like n=2 Tax=Piliocolobus tephrosceles TaxID=591936 RepID=A0A8C9HIT5_9PRIM